MSRTGLTRVYSVIHSLLYPPVRQRMETARVCKQPPTNPCHHSHPHKLSRTATWHAPNEQVHMTSDRVHFFGHSFVSKIFWHIYIIIAVRTVVVASPQFLASSEGMLSTYGDFHAFFNPFPQHSFQPLVWGSGYSGVG